MNKIIYILFLLISAELFGANIYVSETGSDSNNGLTEETAIQSLTKLQTLVSSLEAGDSVLFERGGEFYGTLTLASISGASGNPITVSDYGNGNKPVLHGWETMSSWTNEGGGIYSAATTADGHNCQVTFNGVNQEMGRTENYYFDGGNDSLVYDTDFIADQNYVGAEIVTNNRDWIVERHTIERVVDDTIEIIDNFTYALSTTERWYFLQNSYSFLSGLGDWYCSSDSGKIYMYFAENNPNDYTVNVSSIDTIISITSSENININNISILGGSRIGIYAGPGSNSLFIDSCDISNNFNGIFTHYSDYDTISNCTFSNNTGCAIKARWDVNYSHITKNTITNTGILAGHIGSYYYTSDDDGFASGVYLSGNNNLINYNSIVNTGYNGIFMRGSDFTTENNYIDSAVMILLDGGGIYTGGDDFTNRIIRNNIINNAEKGIFLDENARDVLVYNNSVSNCWLYGLMLHKANNDTMYNNTFWHNGANDVYYVTTTSNINDDCDSNYFVNNVCVSEEISWQARALYLTVENYGTIDSNIYLKESSYTAVAYISSPSFTGAITLSSWQTDYGYDLNSTLSNNNTTEYYYNETQVNKYITFPGYKKTDVYDNEYINGVILEPFTSVVFYGSESTTTIPMNAPSIIQGNLLIQ